MGGGCATLTKQDPSEASALTVGSPPRAVKLLREAQALAPDDYRVAAERGGEYLSMGRNDEALAAFGRALALAPRRPEAYNNRGVALSALGQRQAVALVAGR